MMQFNVLTEPWIEAVDGDGNRQQYGLLPLLTKAHTLRQVVDPSPVIQFGLYRLLVTFVQHALQLFSYEDLAETLDEGAFDMEVFEKYVEGIGVHRFDLFDSERPFLQTPPMEDDKKKIDSVVRLFYHFPAGSNVIHFFRMEAEEHAVASAVAARALCSIAPFMMSGGAGYSPSVNGTPPWYLQAIGENLFQTILLNCCAKPISGLKWDVPPAWATNEMLEPRAEKTARSLAEGFTWQPRQVRLLAGEGGVCTYTAREESMLIRHVVWGPGHKFGGHDTWMDPNVPYTLDDRRGRLPFRPRPDRQLWRDYGPLFLREDGQSGKDSFQRPAIVSQLADLKRDLYIAPDVAERFEVYGMRVDKAKVFEWQYERMPLSTPVLQNPDADAQVTTAIELSEKVSTGLYRAMKRLYPRDSRANAKVLDRVIQRLQAAYWDRLGERFQTQYLPALAAQRIGDEVARDRLLFEWATSMREIGWECFNEAADALGTTGRAIKQEVDARTAFAKTVAVVLGDILQTDEGRENSDEVDD